MSHPKEGSLRVWFVSNPPCEAYRQEVGSVDEAVLLIEQMSREDLSNPLVESNAAGLEVFENGSWADWCGEDGQSVEEILRAREDALLT